MKIVVFLLLVACAAPAAVAETEPAPPAPASSAREDGKEPPKPRPDDKIVAQPGNLRETVTRSLELFVPSEEIDVDKPVDFPTNI